MPTVYLKTRIRDQHTGKHLLSTHVYLSQSQSVDCLVFLQCVTPKMNDLKRKTMYEAILCKQKSSLRQNGTATPGNFSKELSWEPTLGPFFLYFKNVTKIKVKSFKKDKGVEHWREGERCQICKKEALLLL